jgi:broad specificity phosphatase PhoE
MIKTVLYNIQSMIFFIRHGESEANAKGLLAGQKDDSKLTLDGVAQAKAAGSELRNSGIKIDNIICSTLSRARVTAEVMAHEIGFDTAQIKFDARLIEYDLGSLSGKSKKDIAPEDYISGDGAEDVHLFQERVMSALNDVKDILGNTLVVSHSGVWRVIEATLKELPVEEFYEIPVLPNAQIQKLVLA